jgi:hypothetical protein
MRVPLSSFFFAQASSCLRLVLALGGILQAAFTFYLLKPSVHTASLAQQRLFTAAWVGSGYYDHLVLVTFDRLYRNVMAYSLIPLSENRVGERAGRALEQLSSLGGFLYRLRLQPNGALRYLFFGA